MSIYGFNVYGKFEKVNYDGLENKPSIYTKEEIDTKVNIFHASIDSSNFQYVKDSADFTYADVVATENCKIEATCGNIRIILKILV